MERYLDPSEVTRASSPAAECCGVLCKPGLKVSSTVLSFSSTFNASLSSSLSSSDSSSSLNPFLAVNVSNDWLLGGGTGLGLPGNN